MSVREAQRSVSSLEFAEWIAFYLVEAEMSGTVEREPTEEELGNKLAAWAAMHNAKQGDVGKVKRVPR
jgi:hypothetical protein